MNLKNKCEFIVIIIITILAIFCLIKDKKDTKNDNPFSKYTFYKEDYKSRYYNYQKKTNLNNKDTILYVNIGLDNDYYTYLKPTTHLNTNYLLVNKYNYLNKNYVPINLTNIDNTNLKLDTEAYNSFKRMSSDASLNNLNIRIISAYRSYVYQQNLYNKYLINDNKIEVDKYSARAGHSEHQTGLAIDIDNNKTPYTDFLNTKEYLWMQKNCYKYGFILRYPMGKEKITGYTYEPWHYRYVGDKISTYIYKNNITFEEYYYMFIDI